MFTLKVGTVEQYLDIDSDTTMQRVPYEILETKEPDEDTPEGEEPEPEVVQTRIQAFPLDATAEEITDALKGALEVFKSEAARAEASKAAQAALDEASQVGEAITGVEIT